MEGDEGRSSLTDIMHGGVALTQVERPQVEVVRGRGGCGRQPVCMGLPFPGLVLRLAR